MYLSDYHILHMKKLRLKRVKRLDQRLAASLGPINDGSGILTFPQYPYHKTIAEGVTGLYQ